MCVPWRVFCCLQAFFAASGGDALSGRRIRQNAAGECLPAFDWPPSPSFWQTSLRKVAWCGAYASRVLFLASSMGTVLGSRHLIGRGRPSAAFRDGLRRDTAADTRDACAPAFKKERPDVTVTR